MLNDDEYYVIKFENGKYYSSGVSGFGEEVSDIKAANTYVFDWLIMKDLYFLGFMNGKDTKYSVVRVKITKIYEELFK